MKKIIDLVKDLNEVLQENKNLMIIENDSKYINLLEYIDFNIKESNNKMINIIKNKKFNKIVNNALKLNINKKLLIELKKDIIDLIIKYKKENINDDLIEKILNTDFDTKKVIIEFNNNDTIKVYYDFNNYDYIVKNANDILVLNESSFIKYIKNLKNIKKVLRF